MEFPERLKRLRTLANLTQQQLCSKVGVSVMTVRNWESGAKQPSMSAIIALSKTLHVSSDTLLGIQNSTVFTTMPKNRSESTLLLRYQELDSFGRRTVDAVCSAELSRVRASNVIDFMTEAKRPDRYIPKFTTPSAAGYSFPLDGDEFEMLLVDDSVPENADFAVVIQGSSMEPYIFDGDTVFVKKQYELGVGDVGIFSVDGAMYCKIFYIDDKGNLTLVSANPELKESNVRVNADSDTNVVCCGKVLLPEHVPFPAYFGV